ncbi:MAG: hypothetical protein U9O94_00675 [Nanoarchaeota archaeon]|nr:hypothetical protein [Nanoarchaeota archaeon]
MAIDKEELEKLTPAEKIKKLKEIEEQNKKEIREAEKLIKETESKIKGDKIAESVNVPETKPVDISELFAPEGGALEQAAKEAESGLTDDNVKYFVKDAYDGVREALYGEAESNTEMMEKIDAIGEKLERVKYFHVADEIANLAVAAKQMIYKLRRGHDGAW